MKRILSLLAVVVSGCTPLGPEKPRFAGFYEWNISTACTTLELHANGKYSAQSDIDIFPKSGKASGTWRSEGSVIYLSPKKEDGDLVDRLRVLTVHTIDGRIGLLRREDARYADNELFYYFQTRKPK